MAETETLVSQADAEAQELASQTLDEAQELASQAEGEAQEPSIADLKAQIEEARRAAAEAQEQLRQKQSAADREIAAARKQFTDFQRSLETGRSQAEVNRLRALRDSEDPDDRDEYLRTVREQEATFAAQQAGRQEYLDRTWRALVSNPRFDSLTVAEKTAIDQELRDKYGASPDLLRGGDFNADLAGELAAAVAEKAAKPSTEMEARIKTMEEELTALRAARAGTSLRESGGPERPMEGGGAGRLTPKSYAEKLKRGEVVSPEEIDAMTAAYLQ